MRDGEASETERSADTTTARIRQSIVLRGVLPDDDTFVRLAGRRWVLGRGDECDVQIHRPRVSRTHAEVVRRGPVLTIRDLGSTNGTNVDGKRVDHASIGRGAVVRMGEWLGVVDELDADSDDQPFAELAPGVWGGAVLAAAVRVVALAARSRVPVLLIGKTGTGKERLARALHHFAGPELPFRAINCAALPASLAEAELFGYRKGAFTGADRSSLGHLRSAGEGVVFLDEVPELPPPVQAKLLRALDTGEIAPLGEVEAARFDARIVATTQEPLSELVKRGVFRQDLAARLSGVIVELPGLAERRSDIPSLFHRFLREHSGGTAPPVSVRLYESLCLYDWPDNVRELELLARRLLTVRGMEPLLRRSHLPEAVRDPKTTTESPQPSAAERNGNDAGMLESALRRAGGNIKAAAKIAGISRQRAYRLIDSQRLGELVSETRERKTEGTNGRED